MTSSKEKKIIDNLRSKLSISEVFSENTRGLSLNLDDHFSVDPLVYFDMSLYAASSGYWSTALTFVEKVSVVHLGDESLAQDITLWKMKCYFENEFFAEALALSNIHVWSSSRLIHVEYLSAQCFEKLEMFKEAREKYNAVYQKNKLYKDVAKKLAY